MVRLQSRGGCRWQDRARVGPGGGGGKPGQKLSHPSATRDCMRGVQRQSHGRGQRTETAAHYAQLAFRM